MKAATGKASVVAASAVGTLEEPTAGHSRNVDSGSAACSPATPPTPGADSAYQASTTAPSSAIANCTRSAATTPRSPVSAAYPPVAASPTRTPVSRFHPSETDSTLAQREVHPADDEAVDGEPEIERTNDAQHAGGPSRIAQFDELDIGQDARTAP